jgi:hypothetical protein
MIHCKNSSLAYDLSPHEGVKGREIWGLAGQIYGPKRVQVGSKREGGLHELIPFGISRH